MNAAEDRNSPSSSSEGAGRLREMRGVVKGLKATRFGFLRPSSSLSLAPRSRRRDRERGREIVFSPPSTSCECSRSRRRVFLSLTGSDGFAFRPGGRELNDDDAWGSSSSSSSSYSSSYSSSSSYSEMCQANVRSRRFQANEPHEAACQSHWSRKSRSLVTRS